MDPTTGAISKKKDPTDTLNHQLTQHITTEKLVPPPTQIVQAHTHENAEYNTKLKIDKLLCDMLQWKCEWLDEKEDQLLAAGEGALIPMMHQYDSYKSYMR
jgi:formylmethanofuran:tetrahydromethanopterin formyltransferase